MPLGTLQLIVGDWSDEKRQAEEGFNYLFLSISCLLQAASFPKVFCKGEKVLGISLHRAAEEHVVWSFSLTDLTGCVHKTYGVK